VDYLIGLGFVAALGVGLWLVIRRSREFERVLARHGFRRVDACAEEIAAAVRALFDAGPSRRCHRSGPGSPWGEDAWVVSLDRGGDLPSLEVLLVPAPAQELPEFVAGVAEGVGRIGGLVKWLDRVDAPYQGAGFHLLPEELQPFLSRRRGLLLYAREDVDLRKRLPPALFERLLQARGVHGAACSAGHVLVWTCNQAAPDELFEVAAGLRS
jgi:hypothetical protein